MLVTVVNGLVLLSIMGAGYMGWSEFCRNMQIEEPFAKVTKYICGKICEFTSIAWAYAWQYVSTCNKTKGLNKDQKRYIAGKTAEAFDKALNDLGINPAAC